MAYSEVITYDTSGSLAFDNTKVQVTGGHVQLVGPPYTTSSFTSSHVNSITALSSFAESSTLPGSTSITYVLMLNGVNYWYNATNSTWAVSDGTASQSNSASTINSQASVLISQLAILTNVYLGLKVWLQTSNTNNTPQLTTNTIGYTWTEPSATQINQCTITAYLADLIGGNPVPTTNTPVQLLVSADRAFFHGNHLVEPFTKSFSFNTSGVLTASVIETATPGVPLNFSLTYYDGQSLKTTKLFNAIVPNQPSISIQNLSSVYPYDFG